MQCCKLPPLLWWWQGGVMHSSHVAGAACVVVIVEPPAETWGHFCISSCKLEKKTPYKQQKPPFLLAILLCSRRQCSWIRGHGWKFCLGMSASLLSHQEDAAPHNPDANEWLKVGYPRCGINCPTNFVFLPGESSSSNCLGRLLRCAAT